MWWVTLRNVMRNVVTYPHKYRIYHRYYIGMDHMCITQSDTFRYARSAFFGDGDGGRGHGAIAAWILTTPNSFYSKFANVTRATHATPAPAYKMRVRSLHTGVRQRCACVFLVVYLDPVHIMPLAPFKNIVKGSLEKNK